jgi:hypothetical protein
MEDACYGNGDIAQFRLLVGKERLDERDRLVAEDLQ